MEKIILAVTFALFACCNVSSASPADTEEVLAYMCSLCGEAESDCLTSRQVREGCIYDLLVELENALGMTDLQKRRGFIGKRRVPLEKRRGFIGKRRGFIG